MIFLIDLPYNSASHDPLCILPLPLNGVGFTLGTLCESVLEKKSIFIPPKCRTTRHMSKTDWALYIKKQPLTTYLARYGPHTDSPIPTVFYKLIRKGPETKPNIAISLPAANSLTALGLVGLATRNL